MEGKPFPQSHGVSTNIDKQSRRNSSIAGVSQDITSGTTKRRGGEGCNTTTKRISTQGTRTHGTEYSGEGEDEYIDYSGTTNRNQRNAQSNGKQNGDDSLIQHIRQRIRRDSTDTQAAERKSSFNYSLGKETQDIKKLSNFSNSLLQSLLPGLTDKSILDEYTHNNPNSLSQNRRGSSANNTKLEFEEFKKIMADAQKKTKSGRNQNDEVSKKENQPTKESNHRHAAPPRKSSKLDERNCSKDHKRSSAANCSSCDICGKNVEPRNTHTIVIQTQNTEENEEEEVGQVLDEINLNNRRSVGKNEKSRSRSRGSAQPVAQGFKFDKVKESKLTLQFYSKVSQARREYFEKERYKGLGRFF